MTAHRSVVVTVVLTLPATEAGLGVAGGFVLFIGDGEYGKQAMSVFCDELGMRMMCANVLTYSQGAIAGCHVI